MSKIAERFTWAVETLNVQPDDQILEIGCGHGVAVDLICEHLKTGRVTGIDRSDKMIDAAEKRNTAHVTAGKAVFHATSLEDADLEEASFNTIFAINVSPLWTEPASTLPIVKRHLASGGLLFLFHQPPAEDKTHTIADQITKSLTDHGFTVEEVLFQEADPATITCVRAALS